VVVLFGLEGLYVEADGQSTGKREGYNTTHSLCAVLATLELVLHVHTMPWRHIYGVRRCCRRVAVVFGLKGSLRRNLQAATKQPQHHCRPTGGLQ